MYIGAVGWLSATAHLDDFCWVDDGPNQPNQNPKFGPKDSCLGFKEKHPIDGIGLKLEIGFLRINPIFPEAGDEHSHVDPSGPGQLMGAGGLTHHFPPRKFGSNWKPCWIFSGLKRNRCNLTMTRWWFQIFFMFIPTWGNDPLIFFRWVETTNLLTIHEHVRVFCA